MEMLDLDALAREFADYQLQVSRPQLVQVRTYLQLLLRWNERVNLTGLRAPRRIVRELFCESMYLSRVLPLQGSLLDVGSGAGFPGLALKLACPQLRVALVEASQRKCAFLKEVVRRLQLSDVLVFCARIDRHSKGKVGMFDLATTRAVAVDGPMLAMVRSFLFGGGEFIYFCSGRGVSRTVPLAGGFEWLEPVPIPHTRARVILIGVAKNVHR